MVAAAAVVFAFVVVVVSTVSAVAFVLGVELCLNLDCHHHFLWGNLWGVEMVVAASLAVVGDCFGACCNCCSCCSCFCRAYCTWTFAWGVLGPSGSLQVHFYPWVCPHHLPVVDVFVVFVVVVVDFLVTIVYISL